MKLMIFAGDHLRLLAASRLLPGLLLAWTLFGCAMLRSQPSESSGADAIAMTGSLPNCNVKGPPRGAARSLWHGNEVLNFPPSPGGSYTGCFWVWIVSNDTVHFEGVSIFREGELVSYRSTERLDKGSSVIECTYELRKLVKQKIEPPKGGSIQGCPDANEMRSVLTAQPRKEQ